MILVATAARPNERLALGAIAFHLRATRKGVEPSDRDRLQQPQGALRTDEGASGEGELSDSSRPFPDAVLITPPSVASINFTLQESLAVALVGAVARPVSWPRGSFGSCPPR